MATLNSILVPWLIAEFGIDYADWDNQKTATAMIAHVIMTEQLGGYTARTFPEMIDGYRVQQVAFTKMVLTQIGNFCAVFFEIILPLISFSIFSGKANIIHRNDLRQHLIKLFCTTREVQDREQIVAAIDIGVSKMTDIILSRHRLPYLDQLCEEKGIIGEQIIFQTRDNKEHKMTSILGEGTN